ncbi:MAG: DegV family protein [Oscillospiraceae bacterium]
MQSGQRTFPDDGSYTALDLYADYQKDGTLPKTAAVSPEEFKNFFAPILDEGFDIVHIDISSNLSCTCQNALLAATEMEAAHRIHVVDSRQLSTGGALLALQGAKLRDQGLPAAEIAEELRRPGPFSATPASSWTPCSSCGRGGRCSGVTALGANVLKLKPCLEMREGNLVVCKKYRGSIEKIYPRYISQRLAGKSVVEDWAFITHSGQVPEETLRELTEQVKAEAPFREVFITQAGCTVSSHCGPKTLGVLFLRKE